MTHRRPSLPAVTAAALLLLAMSSLPAPAHAFWGLLGKVGSAAGKGAAGAAGKGAAATGAGTLAGVEAAEAANAAAHAARAAKPAVAAEGAMSAEQLAKASGLGKAVPDDIAAMLTTPGKTLLDVPDAGTRSWLSQPGGKLARADADLMVTDYVRLLEGKPAAGPRAAKAPVAPAVQTTDKAAAAPRLPTAKPASSIPWHATELLLRAAHLGHPGAQRELERLCRGSTTDKPAACRESRDKLTANRN